MTEAPDTAVESRDDDEPKESENASARHLAWTALQRIDHNGAYANIVVPSMLTDSGLDERDRKFVTNLVYGATRMRRALDDLMEPFLLREPDDAVRSLLRLGVYQLHFLGTPPHAAVSATVELAPKKARGFVNAVLRRVSEIQPSWPDDGVRLSYPGWLVDRLRNEWGDDDTLAMLEHMNRPATVTERDDGYVQDLSSQWVVAEVAAEAGHLVADVCAAPGGKATAIAATGATVIAGDRRRSRAGLVRTNAERVGSESLSVLVADGANPALRPASFDRVLVDAPCSGVGVLRRRPDARWHIDHDSAERLAALQQSLLVSAAELVKPGGQLVYSVCTILAVETAGVAAAVPAGFSPRPLVGDHWRPFEAHGEGGGVILPHDNDTDGMAVFAWQRD